MSEETKRIITPDDPKFFKGTPDEVIKRVNLFLTEVGTKYNHADVQMYEEWEEIKYERPVVDVTEWIHSDEHMGRTGRRTFEVVKDEFFRIMSQEKRPMQLILKGAIGWGKTFLSALIMGRIIYELSCLRSPQTHYGLAYDSNIVLMNLSITKTHASRVLYSTLREMLDSSPYFQEVFPRYSGLNSQLVWPQKHLSFVPGSSSELSPLGENLLGGVIEEANFFPIVIGSRRIQNPDEKEFDAAKHLRDALWRRMKSRYQVYGRVPGMLILNSGAKYPDDYLERLARESDPEETLVIEHSMWDTKPKALYSGEKMYVFIGDSQILPKIVEKEGELEEYRARGEVIDVPVEYRSDFEKDILGSIRDIAGKNIRAIDRFISDDVRIDYMFELGKDLPKPYHNRFDHGVFCNELDTAIHPINLLRMEERFLGKEKLAEDRTPVLQLHPDAPRFIHIDLSSTGAATGFCIGHVGEIKEIERRIEQEGGIVEVLQEVVPVIYVDVLLRILPPEGGEIEFEAIRDLIHRFHHEAGMRYSKITFDQYQSKHSQQLLRKKFGEDVVKPLSVDRTNDAYLALKETIYEKRLHCPFSPPLSVELSQLQISPRTGKVDHIVHGSKDCADALAGMVFNAVNDFDKGLIDEVQFGDFEDTELTEEEQMAKRMTAWLLGDPDADVKKEVKSLGKRRTVLTVTEFDRRR